MATSEMKGLMGAMIILVVGFILYTVVNTGQSDAIEDNEATLADPNASETIKEIAERDNNLLGLGTLFYILILVFGAGASIFFGATGRL